MSVAYLYIRMILYRIDVLTSGGVFRVYYHTTYLYHTSYCEEESGRREGVRLISFELLHFAS